VNSDFDLDWVRIRKNDEGVSYQLGDTSTFVNTTFDFVTSGFAEVRWIDGNTATVTVPRSQLPALTGLDDIRITNASDGNTVTVSNGFEYVTPTVTGIVPNVGPDAGGAQVTLQGTDFGFLTVGYVPISLSNNSGSDQSEFHFVLDTESLFASQQIEADCSQIGITNQSGTQNLDYWFEGPCDTSYSSFWVVADSPVSDGQTLDIRVYFNSDKTQNSDSSIFSFSQVLENDSVVWLKANNDSFASFSDGDSVGTWVDESGTSDFITKSNRDGLFRQNILNGLPAVEMNGTSILYRQTNLEEPFTISYVSQMKPGGAAGRVLSSNNRNWLGGYHAESQDRFFANTWIHLPTITVDNTWKLYTLTGDNVSPFEYAIYESGTLAGSAQVSAAIGPGQLATNCFSGGTSECSDAYITEIIALNSVASSNDQSIIENYLAKKYDINDSYTPTIGAFQSLTTVEFGAGNFGTDITYIDPNSLTVVTPPGTGVVDVIYSVQPGDTATLSNGYSYGVDLVPEAIDDLTLDSETGRYVDISWSPPFDGGNAITDYEIAVSQDNFATETIFADGVSTNTSVRVDGLNPGQNYQFVVRAINGVGTGSDSNSIAVTQLDCDVDFGGADYIIDSNTTLPGDRICNVGLFEVQSGITATLPQEENVIVYANSAIIEGTIDGAGRGFQGGGTNGCQSFPGQGPGASLAIITGSRDQSFGASHGGYGGRGTNGGLGSVYGSVTEPITLGSGAAGSTGNCGNGTTGGSGGGSVKISTSETLTHNGTITVNGTNGGNSTWDAGGGSGGSVWIESGTFTGTGAISANGGNTFDSTSGGGGGGRIAVYYSTNSYTGSITSFGGSSPGAYDYDGSAGTIYERDTNELYGDITIDNGANNSNTGDLNTTYHTPLNDEVWVESDLRNLVVNGNAQLYIAKDITLHGADLVLPDGVSVRTQGVNSTNSPNVTIGGRLVSGGFDSALGDVAVTNTGFFTHNQNTTSQDHTLAITVANLTVSAGGQINLNGRGYEGGATNGCESFPGQGPGGSLPITSGSRDQSFGASHGGYGGRGTNGGLGSVYGSVTEPVTIGSGAAGSTGACGGGLKGGDGGGAIKITATGTITIDGNLSANGDNGANGSWDSGGGAGGSLWLDANTIAGSGSITTNGGNTFDSTSGGGGGGRIALYYDTKSFAGTLSAYGGLSTNTVTSSYQGSAGTIYERDKAQTFADLTIDNSNNSVGNSGSLGAHHTPLNSAVLSEDTLNSIIIGANSNVDFDLPLTLNTSSFVLPTGTNTRIEGLSLLGTSDVTIAGVSEWEDGIITPINNLVLQNGAILRSVAEANPVDAGLEIQANTITLDSGSLIDVSFLGYEGGNNTNGFVGQGPGGGGSDGTLPGGGGYGGVGGAPQGGSQYGSITQPVDPGSGGGGSGSTNEHGGAGGGIVKLVSAGDIIINGSIRANGQGANVVATNDDSAGGSGGSIWLDAGGVFGGSGTITANGGVAAGSGLNEGGTGAGGRIALYYDSKTFTGSVKAGTPSPYSYQGGAGTIYEQSNLEPFGVLTIDNTTSDSATLTSSARGLTEISDSYFTGSTFKAIEFFGNPEVRLNNDYSIDGPVFDVPSGPNINAQLLTFTNTPTITIDGFINVNGFSGALDTFTINNGGVLTHLQNNTTQQYSLDITANTMTINSGGTINLLGKGYSGGNSSNGYTGQGPGGGLSHFAIPGGGGYGGVGGGGSRGGPTYGSLTEPIDIGSGGGGSGSSNADGGNGGGAVKLTVAGTLTIDGTINADGQGANVSGINDDSAGGSGGSIWLTADAFNGAGSISADGGTFAGSNAGGTGGGGRIALYYNTRLYSGTVTVNSPAGTHQGGVGTIYEPNVPEANLANAVFDPIPQPVSTGVAFEGNISNILNVQGFNLFSGSCDVTITGPGGYNETRTGGSVSQGVCSPSSAFLAPTQTGSYTASVTVVGNDILSTTETNTSILFTVASAASGLAQEDGTNPGQPTISSLTVTPNPAIIGTEASSIGGELEVTASGLIDSQNGLALNNTACTFTLTGPNSYSESFVTSPSTLVGGECSYLFNLNELPDDVFSDSGQYDVTLSIAGVGGTLTTPAVSFNRYLDVYLEDPANTGVFDPSGEIPGSVTSDQVPIVQGASDPILTSPVVYQFDNLTPIASGFACRNRVEVNGILINEYASTIDANGQCVTTVPNGAINHGSMTVQTFVDYVINGNTITVNTEASAIATTGFPSNFAKEDPGNPGAPQFNTFTVTPDPSFLRDNITIAVTGLLDDSNDQPLNNQTCIFNIADPDLGTFSLNSTTTNGDCSVVVDGVTELPLLDGTYTVTLDIAGPSGLLTSDPENFGREYDIFLSGGFIPGTISVTGDRLLFGQADTITSPRMRRSNNITNIANGTVCKNTLQINTGPVREYTGTISGGRCITTVPATDVDDTGTAILITYISLFNSDFDPEYTFQTAVTNETVSFPPTAKICAHTFRDDSSDQIQNGVEPLLGGVSTVLLDSGGSQIAQFNTTNTLISDNCFENLYDGTYTIRQTRPSNGITTVPTGNPAAPEYTVVLNPGDEVTELFGYNGNAEICPNPTFIDINEDGVFNGTDYLLSGQDVRLYESSDLVTPVQTITTDGTATSPCFANVIPGDYVLEQDLPSGTEATTGTMVNGNTQVQRSVTLNFGIDAPDQSFGFRLLPSNLAQAQEAPNETKPVNTGISLQTTINPTYIEQSFVNYPVSSQVSGLEDSNTNLPLNGTGICSATFSGPSFSASITVSNLDVVNGVCEVTNANSVIPDTVGVNNSVVFTIQGDSGPLTTDPHLFDVTAGLVTIVVDAFADFDQDGTQDSGEPFLSGITTEISDDGGVTALETILTNASGTAQFTSVDPGIEYTITQTAPTGTVLTVGTATRVFTPFPEDTITESFAYKGDASITPIVFNDTNRNGVNDTEDPVNGVFSASLQDPGGATIASGLVIDSSNSFDELLPTSVLGGNYTVLIDEGSVSATHTTANDPLVTSLSPGESLLPEFGYASDAQICPNPTFADYDGDSNRDGGEDSLTLVTRLYRTSDTTLIDTISTDNTSCFNQVGPGLYYIEQDAPVGGIITSPGTTQAGGAGTVVTKNIAVNFGISQSHSFGYIGNATICPYPTFEDYNLDGVQDVGELDISGITTRLRDLNGDIAQSLTTDSVTCFNNLIPGTWRVEQSAPTNTTPTTGPLSRLVVVADGATENTSFGYDGTPEICPAAFQDNNQNGSFDGGEARLGGATILLKDATGTTTLSTLNSSTSTTCFNFQPTVGETYIVEANPLSNYSFTTPNTQTLNNVGFGQVYTPQFGYYGAGDICVSQSFIDTNTNGVWDTGEPFLDGLSTELFRSGSLVQTVTTPLSSANANPNDNEVCFSQVIPGTYTVIQTGPVGSSSTTGGSQQITLTAGGTQDIIFGYTGSGTICAAIFDDIDFDTLRDPSETLIAGVTIDLELQSSPGIVLESSASTGASPTCFTNLFPEDYRIEISNVPSGYGETTLPVIRDVTIDQTTNFVSREIGLTNDPDFLLAALRGFVYVDRDEDGEYDAFGADTAEVTVFDNDVPVTEQEIKLFQFNTTTLVYDEVQSLITDSVGEFSFLGLDPGDYIIVLPEPLGTQAVIPAAGSTLEPGAQQLGPFTITSNEKVTGLELSVQYTARICPALFLDRDNDGFFEPNGADGNPNTTGDNDIDLIQNAGGYYQLRYQSFNGTQTASNGNAKGWLIDSTNPCIEHVPPRDYTVVFRSDLTSGANNPNYDSLFDTALYNSITANQSTTVFLDSEITDIENRYFTTFVADNSTADVSGTVWNNRPSLGAIDLDGDNNLTGDDGTNDFDYDNDFVYANVDITLFKCAGGFGETQTDVDNWNAAPPTTTTDSNGNYSFTNIPPGRYAILWDEADIPFNNSLNVNRQNNCHAFTNFLYWYNGAGSAPFNSLAPGTNVNGFDIIHTQRLDIRVNTYLDQNENGTRELGEPEDFISGVWKLLGTDGLIDETSPNDTDYEFFDVPPGDYTLTFETTDTRTPTEPLSIPITVLDTDAGDVDYDFGFAPEIGAEVGGKVFIDRAQNNIYQVDGVDGLNATTFDNDVALENIEVGLYKQDNIFVASVLSDSNGDFIFDNLPEGEYGVRIISPTPLGLDCVEFGNLSNDDACDWPYDAGFDTNYLSATTSITNANLRYNYNGELDLNAFYDTIADLTFDSFWEIETTEPIYSVEYQDGYVLGSGSNFGLLPAGDYTVTINNIPTGSTLTGDTNPNTVTLQISEQLEVFYPLTPQTNNTITGTAFADKKNLDRNYDVDGNDLDPLTTVDNDVPLDGAVISILGPLGTYQTTVNPDATYTFNGLPSGRYLLHTHSPTDTNQTDPIPNIAWSNSIFEDMDDVCMTTLRDGGCKSYVFGKWDWAFNDPSQSEVEQGTTVSKSTTRNNNYVYAFTNELRVQCLDDLNGDGQVTFYPDTGYTESPIPGCSFEVQLPSGEVVGTSSATTYTIDFLPPDTYTIILTGQPSNRVLTNTQRFESTIANYGPVNTFDFTYNNGNLYQDAYFNYMLFTEPITNNASITGKVFIDRNEDGFYQPNGIDGNPDTKEDNDILLKDIPLDLTGGATRSTTTAGDGKYQFTDLAAGGYDVTVTLPSR
jgi:hypothetical protein